MWQALIAKIIATLTIDGIKALFSAFTPRSEDGAKQGSLEKKLREKIGKDGWK